MTEFAPKLFISIDGEKKNDFTIPQTLKTGTNLELKAADQ
jgi:hypothetical protein